MISLKDGSILNLLSSHLRKDIEIQSFSFALSNAIKRLLEYCELVKLYSGIDGLNDKILDTLAVELKTQFYDTKLDTATKKKLVKNTTKWYMKAGTPKAVEELIAAVFGEGKVIEWFDYGGEPFRFKIVTNTTLDNANVEKFKEMIKNVKNVRSILEVVEVERNVKTKHNYGTYTYGYYKAPDIK